MRDAIITLISYGFDHNTFFWGVVLVRAQGFMPGVKYDQVILEQCGKRVKLKVKQSWKLIPTFGEVTGKNLYRG